MRTRAALALFLLAPFCGEVLSGSTPLRQLVTDPFAPLYLPALYGSGALVVREIVRRRGLGWRSIVILGAAYGVLEEGLVVTSWQNKLWPDAAALGDYARAVDVNWIWALHLTAYHAIVSIAIPIVIAERLFPAIAAEPWLSDRAFRRARWLLGAASVLGLALFGFVMFRPQGYSAPLGGLLIAFAIAVALVRLGLRPSADRGPDPRPVPRLWSLRGFAFLTTTAVFVAGWGAPSLMPVAAIALIVLAALLAIIARRIASWSRRTGWDAEHRLALATGALAFFAALAAVLESQGSVHRKPFAGQTLVVMLTLLWLGILAWRAPRGAAVASVAGRAG